MRNLEKFFRPASIAIIGASPKKTKLGHILMRNILSGGWQGKIYCVNPKYKKVGNLKCHENLSGIKKPVDLALVAVPAQFVNRILEEGAKSKPKIENYVIISSGFREIGKNGKELEENLKITAEKYSLNILGPNCLGFINPREKINATFAAGEFRPGKVAFISQSGALAVALLDWARNVSVGFSKVITIGNKAVLDECDMLEYLLADRETKAVAIYVEDIRQGEKFVETAKKISRVKPVLIIKAGKTKTGQKAVSSHTGSLAQDEAVLKSVFEKINLVEAKSMEEFQDLLLILNSMKIPVEEGVLILTNAGGPGVLAADFIGKSKNLRLQKIDSRIKKKLEMFLPESAALENPIDIVGDATPDRYEKTLRVIAQNYPKNPLLVILTPQSQTGPEKVAHALKKYKNNFTTLAVSFMGGLKVKNAVEYAGKNGIANFESPERALLAIEKLVRYSQAKNLTVPEKKSKAIRLNLKANSIIQSALKEKRKLLFWDESASILKSYGINPVESIVFKSPSELNIRKIPFPCVLKSDNPEIFHRWEKKAVLLGIKSERELRLGYFNIKKSTGTKNFVLQATAKPGLEMIFGLKRDADFGPVIIVGWGGTFTELFSDRIILLPPLDKEEILRKLSQLKIFPILKGYRRDRKYNLEEISRIILGLQSISAENTDISQIDINPAMLYNDGSRCKILDVKIFLKK